MFIVMEIQNNKDGTVGTLVSSYDSQNQAASKYHQILAAAALSDLPVHAAVLMNEQGMQLAYSYYEHSEATQ